METKIKHTKKKKKKFLLVCVTYIKRKADVKSFIVDSELTYVTKH